MSNSQDWPKPWSEIVDYPETDEHSDKAAAKLIGKRWLNFFEGCRGYNGTMYVREDIGREANSKDHEPHTWYPIEVYLEHKIEDKI